MKLAILYKQKYLYDLYEENSRDYSNRRNRKTIY
jgi:hypothetical protein